MTYYQQTIKITGDDSSENNQWIKGKETRAGKYGTIKAVRQTR